MKTCFDWKQQSDKEIQFQTGVLLLKRKPTQGPKKRKK